MQLKDVLKEPEFTGLSAENCLSTGNVVAQYGIDSTQYTYVGIGVIFQQANIDVSILLDIPGWIKGLIGGPSMDAFLQIGCDLSNAGIQYYLAANLATRTEPIDQAALNALKFTGLKVGTLWDKYGIEEPTLSDISFALTLNQIDKDRSEFYDRFNATIIKFDNGTITNLADALAAMNNV